MQRKELYIDGAWIAPQGDGTIEVVNPTTEQVIGSVPAGSSDDVNLAVAAAKRAFPEWANSSVETRMAALNDLSLALKELTEELAQTITAEVGLSLIHI